MTLNIHIKVMTCFSLHTAEFTLIIDIRHTATSVIV